MRAFSDCNDFRRVDFPLLTDFFDGDWKRKIGGNEFHLAVGRMVRHTSDPIRVGNVAQLNGNFRRVGPLPKDLCVRVVHDQGLDLTATPGEQRCQQLSHGLLRFGILRHNSRLD